MGAFIGQALLVLLVGTALGLLRMRWGIDAAQALTFYGGGALIILGCQAIRAVIQ